MCDAAKHHGEAEEGSAISALLGGAAFVLAATAIWIALALTTDRTYHLAPVVIAAAPGVIARVSEREISWSPAVIPGLIAVAVGWVVIVAADVEPTVTLAEDQPGGVEGEVIGGALIGALIGLLVSRIRRPAAGAGRP